MFKFKSTIVEELYRYTECNFPFKKIEKVKIYQPSLMVTMELLTLECHNYSVGYWLDQGVPTLIVFNVFDPYKHYFNNKSILTIKEYLQEVSCGVVEKLEITENPKESFKGNRELKSFLEQLNRYQKTLSFQRGIQSQDIFDPGITPIPFTISPRKIETHSQPVLRVAWSTSGK
jgi:hypothetical protein